MSWNTGSTAPSSDGLTQGGGSLDDLIGGSFKSFSTIPAPADYVYNTNFNFVVYMPFYLPAGTSTSQVTLRIRFGIEQQQKQFTLQNLSPVNVGAIQLLAFVLSSNISVFTSQSLTFSYKIDSGPNIKTPRQATASLLTTVGLSLQATSDYGAQLFYTFQGGWKPMPPYLSSVTGVLTNSPVAVESNPSNGVAASVNNAGKSLQLNINNIDSNILSNPFGNSSSGYSTNPPHFPFAQGIPAIKNGVYPTIKNLDTGFSSNANVTNQNQFIVPYDVYGPVADSVSPNSVFEGNSASVLFQNNSVDSNFWFGRGGSTMEVELSGAGLPTISAGTQVLSPSPQMTVNFLTMNQPGIYDIKITDAANGNFSFIPGGFAVHNVKGNDPLSYSQIVQSGSLKVVSNKVSPVFDVLFPSSEYGVNNKYNIVTGQPISLQFDYAVDLNDPTVDYKIEILDGTTGLPIDFSLISKGNNNLTGSPADPPFGSFLSSSNFLSYTGLASNASVSGNYQFLFDSAGLFLGDYKFRITTTDTGMIGNTQTVESPLFSIVNQPLSVLTVPDINFPNPMTNVSYSQELVAIGGVPPYTWSEPSPIVIDPLTPFDSAGPIGGDTMIIPFSDFGFVLNGSSPVDFSGDLIVQLRFLNYFSKPDDFSGIFMSVFMFMDEFNDLFSVSFASHNSAVNSFPLIPLSDFSDSLPHNIVVPSSVIQKNKYYRLSVIPFGAVQSRVFFKGTGIAPNVMTKMKLTSFGEGPGFPSIRLFTSDGITGNPQELLWSSDSVGGTTSPGWQPVATGGLPPGLSLVHTASPDKTVIEGTPTAMGIYPFGLQVKDSE